MDIVRSEVQQVLRRWVEPAALGLALLLALRLGWLGWVRGAWILLAIGAVLALALGGLLYLAILRARLARRLLGVGLVEVDERQITYLAPTLGGSLDLDELRRVALSTGKSGAQNWVLYAPDRVPLVIPLGAEGADELPDAFAALPGLSLSALHKVVQARQVGMVSLWEKQR